MAITKETITGTKIINEIKSSNIKKTEYDTEIEENSVENKIIHEHKKNSNILNKLYNNNNEKYKQLNDYLMDFKLSKDSKQESNITIPGEAKFYIPEHKQYRQWQSFTLSDKNRLQVLVPPKFGNGHLVMSNHVVFSYKLDAYYDRASQFTIKWNDPNYNFWWPIKHPILSERDS